MMERLNTPGQARDGRWFLWAVGALLGGHVEMAGAETFEPGPWYGSVVGGVSLARGFDARQSGVAHMRGESARPGYRDFDLVVDVKGRGMQDRGAMFGLQLGRKFATPVAGFSAAVELEGTHVSSRQHGRLSNPRTGEVAGIGPGPAADPTDLVAGSYGPGEHRFANAMHIHARIAMLHAIVAYELSDRLQPYVGLGVGTAWLRADRAVSYQTHPSGPIERVPLTGEPVNHFNSRDHASASTFTWQARAGMRMDVTTRAGVFIEYRYMALTPTRFTFGSTQYPGHAPTDRWRVANGGIRTHSALAGVQYAL
jgi:opacity protein-like surface antigen